MASSETAPCFMRSSSRPGVAMRISTPRRSRFFCLLMGTPPITRTGAHPGARPIGVYAVSHLSGKLPRRREDQRARAKGFRFAGFFDEAMQKRQRKSCRLSRARLGDAQEVMAHKKSGDGCRLNWRWRLVIFLGKRCQERLCKAEFVKSRHKNLSRRGARRFDEARDNSRPSSNRRTRVSGRPIVRDNGRREAWSL